MFCRESAASSDFERLFQKSPRAGELENSTEENRYLDGEEPWVPLSGTSCGISRDTFLSGRFEANIREDSMFSWWRRRLSSADSSNIPGRTCFVIRLYREIYRKMIVKIILSNDTRVKRIRAFFLQIPEDLIQNNPHHVLNTYLYLILLLKIIVLTLLNDALLGNFWFFEKTSFLLFKFFCRRSRKFNLNKIINIIYFFSIIHLCIWRFLNFFICKIIFISNTVSFARASIEK